MFCTSTIISPGDNCFDICINVLEVTISFLYDKMCKTNVGVLVLTKLSRFTVAMDAFMAFNTEKLSLCFSLKDWHKLNFVLP